jgi:hypothetical protein
MTLNPELRRYLWLELSPGRLMLMPVVLGLILLLIGVWTFDGSRPGGGEDFLGTLSGTASAGYVLLVLFLGARAAANAMVREVADRTWDQQRLSSTGAWSMTWGKLFGSTIYVWYGCAILLAVTLVSMTLWDIHYEGVSSETGESILVTLVQLTIGFVAMTVLIEAAAILVVMTTVSRRDSARQLDVTIAQIVVFVLAVSAVGTLSDLQGGETVYWYGHAFNAIWFAVVSLVLFASWSVIGLWRRMRVELQMKNLPVLWPVFVLFSGIWLSGVLLGDETDDAVTFTVLFVTLTAMLSTYVPAVLERMDPVHLRRLIGTLKERRFAEAFRHAPLWVVSHGMALVGVILSAILLLISTPGVPLEETQDLTQVDVPALAAGTLVAWYLFITRDLLLLMFSWLGKRTRRAFTTWLIWMALLYGLAPMIVAAISDYTFLPAFVPFWDVPFANYAIPPILWPIAEVALVALLLRWRWRRYAASTVAQTSAE